MWTCWIYLMRYDSILTYNEAVGFIVRQDDFFFFFFPLLILCHELIGRVSDSTWTNDRFNHHNGWREGLIKVFFAFVSVNSKLAVTAKSIFTAWTAYCCWSWKRSIKI